jgi:GT2 family glycosyltransferase
MRKNVLISIIIVQYHVKEELFACIQSIYDSKPKTIFEIIVVDNDEKKILKKDLLKKFPKVTYIPNDNNGFGQGNNVGAKYANGEYLFFLNPDTIVFKNSIDELLVFFSKNKKAGVVAPFILHENKKPFEQQGVKTLTPIRAVFALSVINKFFPNNPIAKNYFIQWDTIETKEVDVVPGTAFMIKKKLYEFLNGFDENFFLYFEEFDLCKRIKEKGYKLYIEPKAKIIHLWERSTKTRNDINKIFNQSRFYYFKKHFGIFPALLTNAILNFGKYSFLCLLIILLTVFLLFYKIGVFMPFIGDQAWFYISAKDMLLNGSIPLVGITSSHTWLHQGPLWIYLLTVALWIGHFNPVAGAYLTGVIGLVTVWLVYKVGSAMFSPRVGILASLLYATSPLIVFNARFPYHTSLIATFTLIWFYVLYKWVNGFKYDFPFIIFLSAILYNFELATVMLIPVFILLLIYGITRKTQWVKQILDKKIMLLSIAGLLIPMIPILIYDRTHGFPQTLKFAAWLLYSGLGVFIPQFHHLAEGESILTMLPYITDKLKALIFYQNSIVALLLLFLGIGNLILLNSKQFKKRQYIQSYSLLLLLFIITSVLYLMEKTNSDAYWPMFFPSIIYIIALFFNRLFDLEKLFYPVILFLLIYSALNIYSLFQTNFLTKGGIALPGEIIQSRQIISETEGKEYNLIGAGHGSQYESDVMNYAYLTWWLGHGPSQAKQSVEIILVGTPKGFIIERKMSK